MKLKVLISSQRAADSRCPAVEFVSALDSSSPITSVRPLDRLLRPWNPSKRAATRLLEVSGVTLKLLRSTPFELTLSSARWVPPAFATSRLRFSSHQLCTYPGSRLRRIVAGFCASRVRPRTNLKRPCGIRWGITGHRQLRGVIKIRHGKTAAVENTWTIEAGFVGALAVSRDGRLLARLRLSNMASRKPN